MSTANVRLLRLFVTSYAPLAVMLAIQHSTHAWPPQQNLGFWALLIIGVLGLVDAYRLPRGALRKGHQRAHLDDVVDEGGQVAAYLATYLLPFLGFELAGWREGLSLALYFGVLLIVFLRSDLALVNPALYLSGWRVASANRDGRRVLVLVPNGQELRPGDVYVVGFGSFLVHDGKASP